MKWIYLFIFIPFWLHSEIFWKTTEKSCSVQITISHSSLYLQQPLKIKAVFSYPIHYQIDSDELIEHLLWHVNPLEASWKLLDKEVLELKTSDIDRKSQSIEMTLEPLVIGTLYLSFLNISFNSEKNLFPPIHLFTPFFQITVTSPPVLILSSETLKTAPLLALEPQFPITLSLKNQDLLTGSQAINLEANRNQQILIQHTFPWLTLSFILLLILGWLIGKKIIQWRRQIQIKIPELTAQQKALATLKNLEMQNLLSTQNYKEYSNQLTNIVREYIEKHFHLPLTTQTTDEFLHEVNHRVFLSSQTKELLAQFLYSADQIKFANYPVSFEESQKLKNKTEEIILNT